MRARDILPSSTLPRLMRDRRDVIGYWGCLIRQEASGCTTQMIIFVFVCEELLLWVIKQRSLVGGGALGIHL